MGYKEMPDAVKVPGITPVTKLVLVAITGHANRERDCTMWHSSSSIAEEIGVSKRAVLDAYKTLESMGFITRRERKHRTAAGKVRRGTDVITVHFDRIKASAPPKGAQDDAEPQGGGEESSPGVVNTGNQGGEESSPQNRELNQEPEQGTCFTVETTFQPSSCTVNADASTPREIIGEVRWKAMLDRVQQAAEDRWDTDAYENLESIIRDVCGDQIADYHVEYHHTPPKKAVDRYLAGAWLTTMIHTAQAQGFMLGDDWNARSA